MRAIELLTGLDVDISNSTFSDIVVSIDKREYFVVELIINEDTLLFIETTDVNNSSEQTVTKRKNS